MILTIEMNLTEENLPPDARRALIAGREHLRLYGQTNSSTELGHAEANLRSLLSAAPEYVEGHMLLAFTLGESRQERGAIDSYDQAIRLLIGEIHSASERRQKVLRLQWCQARLLRGKALLRCYRWADATRAVRELRSLEQDLRDMTRVKPTGRDKDDVSHWRESLNLLARSYAEEAHCVGHLLTLMPKYEDLSDPQASDLVELFRFPKPAPGLSYQGRLELARSLFATVKTLCNKARSVKPIYQRTWQSDLASRLEEVGGFAEYRYAQWLPASQGSGFLQRCSSGLRQLKRAEVRRPNDYALLQNIGMIQLDRRFGGDDKQLDTAAEYYHRTAQLKPGDYFSYQQLARLSLIRAGLATDDKICLSFLSQADSFVSVAETLRSGSRTLALLRLCIDACRLSSVGDVGFSESARIRKAIDQYGADDRDPAAWWLNTVASWLEVRAEHNDSKAGRLRDSLLERIEGFAAFGRSPSRAFWSQYVMSQWLERVGKHVGSAAELPDTHTTVTAVLPLLS